MNEDTTPPKRMSALRVLVVIAPFLVFVGIGAVLGQRLLAPGDGPAFESRPAPALDVIDLYSDDRLTRAALTASDDVVVVNFWFSTCPPCIIEHPELMRIAALDGVSVYGVAVEENPDASRGFLEQLGNPFTVAGFDDRRRAPVEWGVRGYPETFILSPSGVIVYKHTGAIQGDDFERVILPAIAEAAERG